MKKYLMIILTIVLSFSICGCSHKSQKSVVKHCILTSQNTNIQNNLVVEYILYGHGKYVEKVEIIETMTSADESEKDLFRNGLSQIYSKYNELYGGFTNEINNDGEKIVSKTTIDYSKINLNKYIEDNSAMKKYYVIKNKKVVFDGIQKLYESLGTVCN